MWWTLSETAKDHGLSAFFSELKSFFTPQAKKLFGFALFLFVVGSLAIYTIPSPEPEHAHEDKDDSGLVLHLFELGGVAAFLMSIVHASRQWKRDEVVLFFVSCFCYALLFEDMNIQLSQDYAYNREAWFVLHNTMLVIVLGWCTIVYCVVLTLDRNPVIRKWNPVEKAVLAGLLALSIDLGIDATAFAYGLWYWEGGSFFGVPIVNFVGWFAAVFWFVFSTEYIKSKSADWDFKRQLKVRVLAIFPDYGGLLLMVGLAFSFIMLLELVT